jgi:PAS domain S-box-containing protein
VVCAEATHEHSSDDESAAVALLARMQRQLATTCAHTILSTALLVVAARSHASAGATYFARMGRLARRLQRRVAIAGPAGRDAWLIGLIAAVAYLIVDLSGAGSAFLRLVADHPEYDLDDMLLGGLVVGVGALAFSVRRWRELGQEVATRTLAEERLDRAQELAGIGSWEYDVAANRYIWSRNMYRLRGLTPDEFDPTSSAVAAYVHPEDEPRIRQYRDDLRAGIPRDPIEGRFIHPNGDVRILRIDGRSIIDGNGVVRRMIGTAHDITEQQSVQRQLAQAQKMEMIGHLAGGMAHDFNNVLGIVIANLELLQEHMIDTASAVASAEELRLDALSAALHGAELTHRLLAFARRQPLRPQDVDVNELVRFNSRMLVRLLGEHIDLVLQLDPALWVVSVDPVQMEAALTNLASNARDAITLGGQLTIATRNLRVGSHDAADSGQLDPGDYVVIEVVDTGVGIPEAIIGRVFDPFFTTKEHGKGSGLGLSMVVGFIEQSGGHVTVRSQPDIGTTFALYLPRSMGHARAMMRTGLTSNRPVGPGTLETLLVVEDNDKLRRATVKQLVQLGYRVFEAPDARAARTILEINDAVCLLFTDVVMPGGMDGIGLVEWARARLPGLRCLATSGYSDLGGREQLLGGLGCKLLSKPYRREELIGAIRAALDQPGEPGALRAPASNG